MGEIKHVEVKRGSDKVVVSVFVRELMSWATVTFEVDDDDRRPSLSCVIEVHGCGQGNKAVVAPDFVAIIKEGDYTITVWNNNGE
jgi:hypothetical protein